MNYRNQVIAVKMTKEEKQFVKEIAFKNNTTMGSIIRDALKDRYEYFPIKDKGD